MIKKKNTLVEDKLIFMYFVADSFVEIKIDKAIYVIPESNIIDFLNSLLKKKKSKIIFCDDFTKLLSLYDQTLSFCFLKDIFEYDNTLYLITLTNLLQPTYGKIYFKNYFTFFPNNTQSTKEKFQNLELLRNLCQENSINLLNKRILSLSSVSYNIYKTCFPQYYKLLFMNGFIDDFVRKSYYGGRTEIFKPYLLNPSYYYDINSLYPFIMKTKEMPVGKPTYFSEDECKNKSFDHDFFGFIEVTIKNPNPNILPVLPISKGDEMGIIYPYGEWRGTYFSEELKLAIDNGYKIITIHGMYVFQKQIIFSEFVDRFYYKKTISTGTDRLMYKDILNTLSGRFGGKYKRIYKYESEENPYENEIGNSYEDIFVSIAVASAITSYSRIFMYHRIQPFYLRKTLVYIDTDGIFLTEALDKDILDNSLGSFRLVSQNQFAFFIASKFYILKEINSYVFKYVFRGITMQSTDIIDVPLLQKGYLSYIGSDSFNNNPLILKLQLVIKKENNILINIFREFYNKRRIRIKGRKKEIQITTHPWFMRPRSS